MVGRQKIQGSPLGQPVKTAAQRGTAIWLARRRQGQVDLTQQRDHSKMLASQRALFDVPRHICYLNSASYSPLPLKTQEAARAAVGRKGTPWTLDAALANEHQTRARAAAE